MGCKLDVFGVISPLDQRVEYGGVPPNISVKTSAESDSLHCPSILNTAWISNVSSIVIVSFGLPYISKLEHNNWELVSPGMMLL